MTDKLVDVVLAEPVIFRPGEYIEVQITRVRVGEPVTVIYRTIVDPGVGNMNYKAVGVEAIRLMGRFVE